MSTVSTILTRAGYRTNKTIGATSDPSTTTCVAWLNEIALWITGICAEENSDLGRTLGSITTIKKTITGITQADPGVVTSASHGLSDGDSVLIKSVVGMTEVNDTWYTVANKEDNTFELSGVDTTDYTEYSSGGYIYKAAYSDFSTMYVPSKTGWIMKTNSRNEIQLCVEEDSIEYSPSSISEPAFFYVDGSNNVVFLDTPDGAYTVKVPYWALPTAMSDGDSTVPFLGIFDNLFIEALVMRMQNRDEYDLSFEYKWFKFISEKARRAISMRKKRGSEVSGIRG